MTKEETTTVPENNPDATKAESKIENHKPDKSSFKSKLKSLFATKKRRIIIISSSVVIILATLMLVPTTRYAIAGTVIKKNAVIIITDSASGKPVSEADVSLAGKTAKTNNKGEAIFSSVPVGQYQAKIEKKYFQSVQQDITVPLFSSTKLAKAALKATGRQVLVKVTNKVSGTPLEKAIVSVSDTKATTDKNGEASIVLPISSKVQNATVSSDGFNTSPLPLTVTDKADQKAEVGLAPAGKIYYLSKRTGKINVVKSNLDGTEPQVVVEGTGREIDYQTSLLASRDWKYLALLARRDGEKQKLYLINTSTDKLSVIDEGDATFESVGWSGHRFVFKVDRNKQYSWDEKKQALKSYDAESGKLATLDETKGGGYGWHSFAYEFLSSVYILNDRLVYVKDWNLDHYSAQNPAHKFAFMSVKTNGESLQRLREIDESSNTHASAKLYAPGEVYFQLYRNGESSYYEYEDGRVKDIPKSEGSKFDNFYPTFLVSPSGKETFWHEPRDGKNTLFVGNQDGQNSKEILSLSEYVPYGWFSDDYLLVSKSGSELYVISRHNTTASPLKVSDYHKSQTYAGYGYGYGGQ